MPKRAMRIVTSLLSLSLLWGIMAGNSHATEIVVYKSPTCGCCNAWIDHLKENGFSVEARNQSDMTSIKDAMGVPRNLRSCHTAQVGGYLVEGHVPAELITQMLTEKPEIHGLSVPGMPMGSPGMEGPRNDPYDILAFSKDGSIQLYDSRNR